jgi:hypothetical protein
MIWGYADGINFDLGVRMEKKVENLCIRPLVATAIPFLAPRDYFIGPLRHLEKTSTIIYFSLSLKML